MTGHDLYRIRDFVFEFEVIAAETARRSRALAMGAAIRRDIAYGGSPREVLDLIFPDNPAPGAPLHMFIHGGYWRSGEKADHSCVAAPVLAAGGIAAIVEYDLMPGTRLGAIVGQVRRAAQWLASNAASFGADPARLSVSGHSAGGHLASLLAATAPGEASAHLPPITGLMMVSGIYDLSGIPGSFLQHENRMTPQEARDFSPLSAHHLPGPHRIIALGQEETAPFHTQARALQAKLADADISSELRIEPGLNHMDVVLALSDTNHALGARLQALVSEG
ncbi:MAG TPA: alpha/beta hydrolase [Paracoccus sp.]|nr:alpha/beta hydrolase [Paracoccus sp. (in: a-proteobacteria)]